MLKHYGQYQAPDASESLGDGIAASRLSEQAHRQDTYPRLVRVSRDTLFVALFRLETDTTDTMVTPLYPLHALPNDSTMGYVTGGSRYEYQQEVTVMATPRFPVRPPVETAFLK